VNKFLAGTRGQLTVTFVLLLAVGLAVADVGLYSALDIASRQESDSALSSQATTIVSGLEETNGQIRFGGGDLPEETGSGIAVDAAVVGPKGLMAQTPTQPLSSATLNDLAGRVTRSGQPIWTDLTDTKGVARRVYARPLAVGQRPFPTLIVSRSLKELQSLLGRTALFLGLFSLLIIVMGGLLAYQLAGRVLRPVRTIAGIARSLSERDLHRRVEVKVPPDEMRELVETFNDLLRRLEMAFESLRRFTGDASHELRAPLSLMHAEIELLRSKPRTKDEYERAVTIIATEVEHLSRLTDQLLVLARADAGVLNPRVERLDVADFVHETATRWDAVAEKRGVQLDVTAPDSGTVVADPALARRVLDNLIDNAIRHSPAAGRVSIRAERGGDGWAFEVADQGPGVPADYRSHLFERFARPDSARSRNGGGVGLGLALSSAIARAHGGELRLMARPGAGAVFQLRLPDRPPVEAPSPP
jgi:heavy metal sensor kinase